MYLEGTVKSYNAERGFGFIAAKGQAQEIFFHIKDFPNKDRPPKIGEQLQFMIVEDQGRFKADCIERLDNNAAASKKRPQAKASPQYGQSQISWLTKLLIVAALLGIAVAGFKGYEWYRQYQDAQQMKTQQLIEQQQKIVEGQRAQLGHLPERVLSEQGERNLDAQVHQTNQPRAEKIEASIEMQKQQQAFASGSNFKCDGRIHCSQMNSREEARWFVRNCPGTKMDGNHDGEPCENDSRW
ncbi:cold shock domain-containing protein [Acinetobacter sp.]|uniref:cold shock domain-containing protein n=1 Tax=Acinetobacter sp. TaxID=472 RepID=UPI0035AEAF0F